MKGTRPSRILQERLDAADAYLSTHPDASCVLSGGQGADEEISEASCMYAYLREKGIEENRLILEDRSVSTAENMAFSRQIFEARGMGEKAVIITSEFHEYRARMLAEACGFTTYADSVHPQIFCISQRIFCGKCSGCPIIRCGMS